MWVTGAGSKGFRKVPESSGAQVAGGSGRLWKLPAQGQVQTASAGSGRFESSARLCRKVSEGFCAGCRRRLRKIPEGSGRPKRVLQIVKGSGR